MIVRDVESIRALPCGTRRARVIVHGQKWALCNSDVPEKGVEAATENPKMVGKLCRFPIVSTGHNLWQTLPSLDLPRDETTSTKIEKKATKMVQKKLKNECIGPLARPTATRMFPRIA